MNIKFLFALAEYVLYIALIATSVYFFFFRHDYQRATFDLCLAILIALPSPPLPKING